MTYLMQRSGQATGDETLASYLKCLQIKRKILGPDHLFVGDTQQYQLCPLHQEGIRTRSSSVRRCAGRMMKARCTGPETRLDVGTDESNIGDVYWAMGRAT